VASRSLQVRFGVAPKPATTPYDPPVDSPNPLASWISRTSRTFRDHPLHAVSSAPCTECGSVERNAPRLWSAADGDVEAGCLPLGLVSFGLVFGDLPGDPSGDITAGWGRAERINGR
jgi:hypothetical protein